MIIYFRSGYLAPNSLVYILGLLVVAFAGSYLGKVALGHIDKRYFRQNVLGFVLLVGLIALGRAISEMIR
jgi:uncharacterized membrane protein YfcA